MESGAVRERPEWRGPRMARVARSEKDQGGAVRERPEWRGPRKARVERSGVTRGSNTLKVSKKQLGAARSEEDEA